jgi:cardiolipin synthase
LIFTVLIVIALAAGLLALAQDQETLRIQSAYGAEDPLFPGYVSALLGAYATGGNRYQVLTNGQEIFPSMLAAVNGARRRISFETYIYNEGAVGEQFTQAFEAAARRGVQVNLVLDALGSNKVPPEWVDRLEAAGAHVGQFGETKWYTLEELNYRTHRKILVVDGAIGFTGGVGLDDQWMGNAENRDQWRDTMVRFEGPVVRFMEGAFNENFVETAGPVAPAVDPPAPIPPSPLDSAMVLRSSPTGGSNDLKRLYLLSIAAARRTLDICTPYFVTDESSMWSLEDARRRGVRVRILVEGDLTDALPVKYASRNAYQRLMDLGIEIYEYQPTMMHAKTMVADGAWSMVGSANFDNRSLELNDEMNVAVSDRDLARRLERDFEQDLAASRRLDPHEWRRRPFMQKVREHFWSYFGEIF